MKLGENFLITTNAFFRCPDGTQRNAVWGTVRSILDSQETLGVKTNAKSTNWYVLIGNMVIAGCQIHYAIHTDCVNFGEYTNNLYSLEHGSKNVNVQCEIYNANEEFKEQE